MLKRIGLGLFCVWKCYRQLFSTCSDEIFGIIDRGIHVTKKKIVWKHHQLLAVAKRAYIIRNDPLFTGLDVAAVHQAQREVLPADLHRPIRSMKEVPRIIHIWKELRHQNYTEDQGVVHPERPIEPPPTRAVPLGEESTANLMNELMARFAEALDEDRLRRLVREEASRVLEACAPAKGL
jgi:hypothetical protein